MIYSILIVLGCVVAWKSFQWFDNRRIEREHTAWRLNDMQRELDALKAPAVDDDDGFNAELYAPDTTD